MTRFHRQSGFTLVELAIVLTIIGLLIGGILKGRQLIQNSRVTATIAQVNAINGAAIGFNDAYGFYPGDMPNADKKIPNCNQCIPVVGSGAISSLGGAGDGSIGLISWNLKTAQGAIAVAPSSAIENETLYFWAELAQAGFISTVSYNGAVLSSNAALFGTHAPAARIGGGFIVGNADGTRDQQFAVTPALGNGRARLSGMVLALTPSIITDMSNLSGQQAMTASTAAQIDRKTDDGLPVSGDTQAYGFNSTSPTVGCFSNALTPTDAIPYVYNESVTGKDCGLFFRITG